MKKNLHPSVSLQEAENWQKIFRAVVCLLFVLLFTIIGFANTDSGAVKVVAFDKEVKEPIPFANIVVYQGKVQVAAGTTDLDGQCFIKKLAPGKYDIKGIYIGYSATQVNNIEITGGRTSSVSLSMQESGEIIYCCFYCCGSCNYPNNGNWWPKLWTPYREMYAAWKEKKAAKEKAKESRKIEPKHEQPSLEEPVAEVNAREGETISRTIYEEKKDLVVTVFPNPCTDVLNIKTDNAIQSLVLTDENGKLVTQIPPGFSQLTVSNYTGGTYHLIYSINGNSRSEKIVIAR